MHIQYHHYNLANENYYFTPKDCILNAIDLYNSALSTLPHIMYSMKCSSSLTFGFFEFERLFSFQINFSRWMTNENWLATILTRCTCTYAKPSVYLSMCEIDLCGAHLTNFILERTNNSINNSTDKNDDIESMLL